MTPLFSGYISTLSGVIAIGGMPERRGRKHEKLEPPRAIVCFYEDFNRAENRLNNRGDSSVRDNPDSYGSLILT
jgi:hypothetical protein